jgi:hypothetical protein
VEVTVGTLASYVMDSVNFTTTQTQQLEGILGSDPDKLGYAAGLAEGAWDLAQSDLTQDAMTFHMLTAAQQYMLPRLISADAKTCWVAGQPDDPTTYRAATAFRETNPPGNYLYPNTPNLRSIKLTLSDAEKLAPLLFGSPFENGVETALRDGPAGAALVKSPFFMNQIAPTSTTPPNLRPLRHLEQFLPCVEEFHP